MRAFRGSVTALVAGVMAFFLLAGGGAAWAFWSATASGAGQANTLSVAVTQSNFDVLRATYTNATLRQTSTGSFTVTNTGEVAGVASTRITATGTVAPQMPIRMWPVSSAAQCTPAVAIPANAASGTWASTTIDGTPLAPGASQTFCVRTTIPLAQRSALASTSGSVSVAGTLSVSLVGTGTGWTAAASGAATQRTEAIYPLDVSGLPPESESRWFVLRSAANANTCLDVAGSGGVGANVISYGCGAAAAQSNQFWQVIPVNSSDPSLVTLRPRHSPANRLAVDATNRQTLAAASPTALAQQWYVQRVSPTTIQFVSAVDGLCLALPGGTTATLTTVDCTNAASVVTAPQRIPLGITTGLLNTTLTFGQTSSGAQLTLQRLSGSTWLPVSTAPAGASSLTFLNTSIPLLSNVSLRLVFPDGTVAYNLVLGNLGAVTTVVSGGS